MSRLLRTVREWKPGLLVRFGTLFLCGICLGLGYTYDWPLAWAGALVLSPLTLYLFTRMT